MLKKNPAHENLAKLNETSDDVGSTIIVIGPWGYWVKTIERICGKSVTGQRRYTSW